MTFPQKVTNHPPSAEPLEVPVTSYKSKFVTLQFPSLNLGEPIKIMVK